MGGGPAVGNLLRPLPPAAAAESVSALAEAPGCRIERIVSHGHATPVGEWYDQDRDEWVAVLCGRARLRFEGAAAPVALGPGDHVLIPARCRHRVEWTDPAAPTVWLAVHFG